MHSDAQFAGSSSVPAHVEMMGFLGIGNNPMVGAPQIDKDSQLVGYRSGYSNCTQQVISTNY